MSKTVFGKHYPKNLIVQVISDYSEHIRTAKQLSEYYEVPYNTVKYWVKKYNKLGIDMLLKPRSGGKNITYDPMFKIRVTEYWLEHPEISSNKIAELFHASRGAIRSWKKHIWSRVKVHLKKICAGETKI